MIIARQILKKYNVPSEEYWTDDINKQWGFLERNSSYIWRLENPSVKMQEYAIGLDPYNFLHIENPSERIKIFAMTQWGDLLKYIKNPSEAVQLAALKNDGSALQYIENQTEEMQHIAVNNRNCSIKDYTAIYYIKNPSIDLQMESVITSALSFHYIKDPPEEVCLLFVKKYPHVLYDINNLTRAIQEAAIRHKDFDMNTLFFIDQEDLIEEYCLRQVAKKVMNS